MDAADKVLIMGGIVLAVLCIAGWIFNRVLERQLEQWREQVAELRRLRDSFNELAPEVVPGHLEGPHIDLGIERDGFFWSAKCSCGLTFPGALAETAMQRRKDHADAALALANRPEGFRLSHVDRGGVGTLPTTPRPAVTPAGQSPPNVPRGRDGAAGLE